MKKKRKKVSVSLFLIILVERSDDAAVRKVNVYLFLKSTENHRDSDKQQAERKEEKKETIFLSIEKGFKNGRLIG